MRSATPGRTQVKETTGHYVFRATAARAMRRYSIPMRQPRSITVFGGTGFVGRHVVRLLAARGDRVRIAVRHPENGLFLKTLGEVGQIDRNPESVARAVEGADAVINCVGILFQSGRQRFAAIHADGAGLVAKAAAKAGAKAMAHVSAIGANANAAANYARTKAAGEAAVKAAFPAAVILRPSVVFGPEDQFFNRFAALARLSPVLPLIGGGKTRFQPVYVGDVAAAIVAALDDPSAAGKTFELGGPRVYSFRELMQIVLRETGRQRLLLPLPFALAMIQGLFFELLPTPPLTRDQVRMLRHDNVADPAKPGLRDLDVDPTPVEGTVESYLFRYRRGGLRPARA